ncbi:MAG TPA: 5-deoxy-glucuronate isomerase [Gaiellaceae bacterium]|nr:5-deoxy-glucuronate isomerase [Gaiellaceae bacterium]
MEIVQVASVGRETELIDLQLLRFGAGDRFASSDGTERCAIVLEGSVEATAAGVALGAVGGRANVFDELGEAVYVPPDLELVLTADAPAAVALAAAALDGRTHGRPRVIRGADQRVASAGRENWSRTIRTLLGPGDDAGRLIVGETINPSGNWSSYPPHKHDRQAPPEEVALEEVYFYRFRPEDGFGVQILYGPGQEQAIVVRDGDVVAIPSGYHPVVAAPGYELYYLWVMAGEGRELAPYFDPQHAWVQAADA